jgi:ribosomal protein S12 methylthiotransferase
MTINIITLGCSKNLVDSERLLFQLRENGHVISHNSNEFSDCVIINTCGFILDAKTESVESILSYAEAKKSGYIKKLIVMGCLSERYKESLTNEIPEVDGFFGVSEPDKILQLLEIDFKSKYHLYRVMTTPSHYAYLKIAEGCNRSCAFCAIPGIRGKQVSIPIDELVAEARRLTSDGVKEILLIAQELTSYGFDIYKKNMLPELLKELVKIEGIEWIRMHYNYPSGFPADEIIELMKKHPKICRYLDIPVQHANDNILKAMKRHHSKQDVVDIIGKFRKEIPDISVRSTIITGFPGEGKSEYAELLSFVKQIKFDRLGAFTYSHEEGTPAYRKFKDTVSARTKKKRLEELLSVQEEISLKNNHSFVGTIQKVIIDGIEGEFYIGRTQFDSPEVDNEVLIPSEQSGLLQIGEFYQVEIFDAIEFDLYGKVAQTKTA